MIFGSAFHIPDKVYKRILGEIVGDLDTATLLGIPGAFALLSAHLKRWIMETTRSLPILEGGDLVA